MINTSKSRSKALYYLLGIDDTDSPIGGESCQPSRDTAALALQLGLHLESLELARLVNISCHQLMAHPSISHTTSNVSCCLLINAEANKVREIDMVCREMLMHESAPLSNPGYALASWNQFDAEIIEWGRSAKINKLDRQAALSLARNHDISMAGITGSGMGVIGALAAVGLRFESNDGWISWMPGLANVNGIYTQGQLSQVVHFDRIESSHQKRPALDDRIQITSRPRPLFRDGKTVLLISPAKRGEEFEWQA